MRWAARWPLCLIVFTASHDSLPMVPLRGRRRGAFHWQNGRLRPVAGGRAEREAGVAAPADSHGPQAVRSATGGSLTCEGEPPAPSHTKHVNEPSGWGVGCSDMVGPHARNASGQPGAVRRTASARTTGDPKAYLQCSPTHRGQAPKRPVGNCQRRSENRTNQAT